MFRRILVPLDGSLRAARAFPLAARLARASGGALFLVRVIDLFNEVRIYSPIVSAYLPEIEEKERASAVDYLAGLAARSEFADIHLHRAVLSGLVVPSLLQIIQQEHIDLVVLCSHGYTGLKRWALGSVAQKMVHQSSVPVLIVPDRAAASAPLLSEESCSVRVLVPLDGSARAEAALIPALRLSSTLSAPQAAHLHLVQIVPLEEPFHVREMSREGEQRYELIPKEQTQMLSTATAYLQTARQRLQQESSANPPSIISSVIADSDTATALLRLAGDGGESRPEDHARTNGYDLMAMTTHGATGLHRWVMGSITERILHTTTLPMLIVPRRNVWESANASGESSTERRGISAYQ